MFEANVDAAGSIVNIYSGESQMKVDGSVSVVKDGAEWSAHLTNHIMATIVSNQENVVEHQNSVSIGINEFVQLNDASYTSVRKHHNEFLTEVAARASTHNDADAASCDGLNTSIDEIFFTELDRLET